MTGIHARAMSTMTTVAVRPVRTIWCSVALGFHFWYKSTVKSVEQALKTPAKEPIRAERSPATTMPRNPGGNMYLTMSGKAACTWCSIGLPSTTSPSSPGTRWLLARAKQINPGIINR